MHQEAELTSWYRCFSRLGSARLSLWFAVVLGGLAVLAPQAPLQAQSYVTITRPTDGATGLSGIVRVDVERSDPPAGCFWVETPGYFAVRIFNPITGANYESGNVIRTSSNSGYYLWNTTDQPNTSIGVKKREKLSQKQA